MFIANFRNSTVAAFTLALLLFAQAATAIMGCATLRADPRNTGAAIMPSGEPCEMLGNAPAPGVPVTISPVTISGGNATFTFPTQAGRYYRIEFSTGLPNWFYLSLVAGDGNVATVQTPSVPSGVRYYRVIELP